MRFIIEQEGIEVEKLWKEVNVLPEKRYERCFTFEIDGELYLMDSVEKKLDKIDKTNLENNFVFNPVEKEYLYYGG